jgi:2-haloacid dehalogenase
MLVNLHPEWKTEITAFWHRWEEMLGGPIHGTVEVLKEIRELKKYKVLALTNWSAETFPIAQQRYDFLGWFDGIVMSGAEKTRKPFPEFYRILLDRYTVDPTRALFIDDSARNIEGGLALGIPGVLFTGPEALRITLKEKGII